MKDWFVACLIYTAIWGVGSGVLDGDLETSGNWLVALVFGVTLATVTRVWVIARGSPSAPRGGEGRRAEPVERTRRWR